MEHVTIVKILYRGLHRDDIVLWKKKCKIYVSMPKNEHNCYTKIYNS